MFDSEFGTWHESGDGGDVGLKVVVVECDANGNVDVADLRAKAEKHAANFRA